jgi:hypothetical protein
VLLHQQHRTIRCDRSRFPFGQHVLCAGPPPFVPVVSQTSSKAGLTRPHGEALTYAQLQKNDVKGLKTLRRAQNFIRQNDARRTPFPSASTNVDIANNSSTRNPAALLMPRSVC